MTTAKRACLVVLVLCGCSTDSVPDARVAQALADARAPDAPLVVPDAMAPAIDARPTDARSGFADGPTGTTACTYPTNATCNTNRSDFSCTESDYGNGWVRQDVTNLDCPNGVANAPCGGSATQPFVLSVIRVCHAGGAGQTGVCPVAPALNTTGPNGCVVCETTNLICL